MMWERHWKFAELTECPGWVCGGAGYIWIDECTGSLSHNVTGFKGQRDKCECKSEIDYFYAKTVYLGVLYPVHLSGLMGPHMHALHVWLMACMQECRCACTSQCTCRGLRRSPGILLCGSPFYSWEAGFLIQAETLLSWLGWLACKSPEPSRLHPLVCGYRCSQLWSVDYMGARGLNSDRHSHAAVLPLGEPSAQPQEQLV